MSKIRNYSSTVSAERSIQQIEAMIAEFGASNVSKDFNRGLCIRMSFDIVDPGGDPPQSAIPLHIVLDANEEAVYTALAAQSRKI